MKKYYIYIVICLIISSLISCKSSKTKEIEKLNNLEKVIENSISTNPDVKKIEEYIKEVKKFAKENPKDTLTPKYLFKAGRLAMSMEEPVKANESVLLFDELISKYPDSPHTPLALFMKAFYLEENMKNLKQAEITYKEFLSKYPEHQLAPDAEKSIEYMGKSPEAIIQEFNEKQIEEALRPE